MIDAGLPQAVNDNTRSLAMTTRLLQTEIISQRYLLNIRIIPGGKKETYHRLFSPIPNHSSVVLDVPT